MSSQTGGDLQTEIDPDNGTGQATKRDLPGAGAGRPFDESDPDYLPFRPGYRGSAKVHVDPKSLGSAAVARDRTRRLISSSRWMTVTIHFV